MEKIIFSQEEIKYINETLNIILDDMNELYKLSPHQNIFVRFWNALGEYILGINDECTVLADLNFRDLSIWKSGFRKKTYYSYDYYLETQRNIEERKTKPKRIAFTSKESDDKKTKPKRMTVTNKEADAVIRFIAKYDSIRTEIINQIQAGTSEKENLFYELSKIRAKYSGDVYVDLGTSRSQNIQIIDVVEEDGKKVGTIDFGSKIVKIITEGDIILNKIEKAKEKVKEKVQ